MALQELSERQVIRMALAQYQIICRKAHGLYVGLGSKIPEQDADSQGPLRAERATTPTEQGAREAWAEVFDAQKSVIGMLVGTLHEIKRTNRHYNFGSKLVRIVDGALDRLPPALAFDDRPEKT